MVFFIFLSSSRQRAASGAADVGHGAADRADDAATTWRRAPPAPAGGAVGAAGPAGAARPQLAAADLRRRPADAQAHGGAARGPALRARQQRPRQNVAQDGSAERRPGQQGDHFR